MSTFLNLDFSNKIELKFFWKHLLFSFLWLLGISLVMFRLDIYLLNQFGKSFDWLRYGIPIFYFVVLSLTFIFFKWYYIIAFLVYPILVFFWFLPKTVLSRGKIYLFGSYVNSVYKKFKYYKFTLFKFFLFTISVIIFLTVPYVWSRWLMIIVITFFYLNYVIKFIATTFRPPTLFGSALEKAFIDSIKNTPKTNKSWLVTYVNQQGDEKLDVIVKKEKQLTRLIWANYTLNLIKENINGFKGKQAFVISWIFESSLFLLYSIAFFWFVNIQVYKIDSSNFIYHGSFINFDFLYYTLKTMTFGDIELIKPDSIIARILEISSFFILGIFFLVIVTSIVLSLKQERVGENIKLATEVLEVQNRRVAEYMRTNFNTDMESAKAEIKTIDESLKNLKNIIDKLF